MPFDGGDNRFGVWPWQHVVRPNLHDAWAILVRQGQDSAEVEVERENGVFIVRRPLHDLDI